MKRNLCLDTDAYKIGHWKAMPNCYTKHYAYDESRNGGKYKFTSWIGLDPVIQDNFLTVPSNGDLSEGLDYTNSVFGTPDYFAHDIWKQVQTLGYIPLHIKALPEGMNVPVSNALFTYESTADFFAPVANSLETLMMHPWYPTTVSTRDKRIKERLRPLVEKSGTIEMLELMLYDFGARGATGYEAAAIGGMAHLMHFQGSDNLLANRHINTYYGSGFRRAKSIWATEHSVALAFGPDEGEYLYLKHQLETCPIHLPFANVIDTYDSFNYMHKIVNRPDIIELIKRRAAAGGATVFRPDSGVPLQQVEMVFEALAGIFGYQHNTKGYKVLNHGVRCIQGDGMNEDTIIELYEAIIANNWSSDNLFVGSGGGLLQVDVNRDTQRFAIKPSYGVIDGIKKNFQKVPKSDMSKASKTGELKVIPLLGGNMMTISSVNDTPQQFNGYADNLKTVFKDGVHTPNNFKDMIERSNMAFPIEFYDL